MSKIDLSFFGRVVNGNLKITDRVYFQKYLYQFEGKEIELIVKKKRSHRSNSQNALFHKWCSLLAEETGYTLSEIKEILKQRFLLTENVNEKTGTILQHVRHTSELNKSEMSDFCTAVQQFCESEFNLRLPIPGETFQIIYL